VWCYALAGVNAVLCFLVNATAHGTAMYDQFFDTSHPAGGDALLTSVLAPCSARTWKGVVRPFSTYRSMRSSCCLMSTGLNACQRIRCACCPGHCQDASDRLLLLLLHWQLML
jgi:hypothetical protein